LRDTHKNKMISPELIAYIRKQAAAGVSKEVIAKSLMPNGWSRQDIDQAFTAAATPVATSTVANQKTIKSSSAGKKIFISAALVAASALYAFFQYAANAQQSPVVTTSIPPVSEQNLPVSTPTTTVVNQTPVVTAPPPQQTKTSTPAPVTTPTPTPVATTPTPITTPPPAPTPKPAGQYADGSYTGNAADAYYGTVQVKAVIQNGALANVQFLQYPNDRNTSRYINSQAMPQLQQEAIQIQSANVDIVSGATFTSQAFQQSLGSALAQAKN
jgi:uncharacterized protein with FMN-binding domain